jgi:N-acetylmuramic acid 6-phosphate etherase
MAREDALVPKAVLKQSRHVARAADLIARSIRGGGKLVFIGAGTSGRLGVIEAAECPPTFGTPRGMIQAVMAGGRGAVFSSREGAEDDARAGAAAARAKLRPKDVLVGIAASGVTAFVGGALKAAAQLGCRTVLVTSNAKPAGLSVDVVIAPKVGPEVVAGSTRLKSGSAAKLVLNILTTAAMIRLGKVYDQWMVDLKPSSLKLRLRAVRLVAQLGKVPPKKAEEILKAAGGSVKCAILMARLDIGAGEARRRLEASDGFLRLALRRP